MMSEFGGSLTLCNGHACVCDDSADAILRADMIITGDFGFIEILSTSLIISRHLNA